MAQNTNIRKTITDAFFDRMSLDSVLSTHIAEGAKVTRDPRNPYAMVVTVGDKQFRVIVKELA
jgi:hypothetical protein